MLRLDIFLVLVCEGGRGGVMLEGLDSGRFDVEGLRFTYFLVLCFDVSLAFNIPKREGQFLWESFSLSIFPSTSTTSRGSSSASPSPALGLLKLLESSLSDL